MLLIKKSGKTEEFSLEKIRNSIAAASDETNNPLNESDLKRILSDLTAILKDKSTIESHQIIIIVAGSLYTKGYYDVIDRYLEYKKKK